MILPGTSQSCPECGDSLQVLHEFPVWCPACDWGISEPQERRKRIFRPRIDRWSAHQVEALYEQISNSAVQRPGWSLSRLGSYAVALCVHGFVIALIAVAAWLIVTVPNAITICIAVVALAVAVELRPRLGNLRKLKHIKRREDAPVLFAVLDQVAAEVGARPVHAVLASPDWNAYYGAVGWRRRRVVTIGLPLWDALPADQKIALLGHEFAHGVNGDARHGTVVGTSLSALARLHRVLRPAGFRDRSRTAIFSALAGLVQGLLRGVVAGLLMAQHLISLRASQRAEYYADAVAGRVASPASMASSLDAMLTGQKTYSFVRGRRRFPNQQADFWTQLRSELSAVPANEKERRRRVDAREPLRVTGTHPPTHLRIKMMRGLPATRPSVVLTDAQEQDIRAELAADYARVGRQIDDDMAG